MPDPIFIAASKPHFHKRRRPLKAAPTTLGLVSASYVTGTSITLTFNMPIDISGIDPPAFNVDDGALTGLWFTADVDPVLVNPTTVRLMLAESGDATVSNTVLNVGPANGIWPAAGGDEFVGVSELVLPFP